MFKKLLYAFLILFAIGTASFAAVTYPVSLAISPKDMFAAPDSAVGYIYIPDTLSGSSRLLIKKVYNDTTAPVTVATISLPGQPLGVATSPDGEKVYVAVSGATQSIKVYSKDGVADTVLPTITNGAFRALRGLAVAPDGKRLYAADALANKVHVIDTVGGTVITSIDVPVVSDVYGVTVSPDNALLAVTRKTTSGSLFVYRIERELDGTISYPLLWSRTPETGTGLYYPNYPIFSPDSKRLYVRVHELSGSYNDVYVYENPNRLTAPTALSIRVPYDIATSEAYTGNNRGGEAMTLSSNGQFLYFIHFRVWPTVAKPVEARFYRVSNLQADGTTLRTDYSTYPDAGLNEGLMYSTTPGTPTPYDGMAASPDGSRIWYSCSEGGSYASLRYTGFTTYPGGVLTNAIPEAPGIVHPASASGDNLNNYTTGAVQWTDGVDDSTGPYHFEVSYKRTSSSTWTVLESYITGHDATLPTSLSNNQWYVVQVRMHDGTYWSDPAFSELFKKSFPLVTSIEVDTDRSPTVSNWQGYDSATNIGYIYDTIKIKGSGFGTVDQPWLNGDGDHNQIQFGMPDKFGNYYYLVIPGQEGTNRRILSWTDTEIIMIVPRAFKDGTVFKANNVRVKVKTNDLLSTYKQFRVGPVITNMAPTSGLAGDAMVTITGAGFGGVTGTDDVYFFDNQLTTINSRVSGADYEQFVVPVPATAATGRVIVRANGLDSSINYQGSPHGTYNEPVIFTVTGVAVQNVAVTAPNGGEILTAGTTANITWTSSGITNVRIRYSANGGLHWGVVTASTPAAAGTYAWVVPSTPTTQGRIEISDAGDYSPLDTSDANFTIQSGGPTGVLIDDFEGGCVDPATGYFAPFGTSPPSRTRQSTVADGAAGTYAMQTLYSWTGGDPSVNWGGGWGGSLRTNQNIGVTGLDSVQYRVRGDSGLETTSYSFQVTTLDEKVYRGPTNYLPGNTNWTTENVPYALMWNDADTDGIRDEAEELFSARADKTIKGYGFAYNGHNTLPITANHYIDNIRAVSGGSAQSPTTTTVARAADAVGSGITLSWTFNDGYAGAADIWTVSGAADSATDIFTTDPSAGWTREFSGVTSPYTDTSTSARVGSNTQKFYKVVRAGTVSLTADMLRVDVAGKFDLNARLGYYSLVSLPIIPAGTDVNTVIGGQMNQEPLEFSADQIFVPRADGGNDTCWLKNDGRWYASGSETVLASVNIDTSKGFYIQNSSMPGHTQKYVTIVGTIETAAARTLNDVPQLYNTIGTPFPNAVPMNSTGLYESGLKAGAFEFAASQIYQPDYSTPDGGFSIAWLKNDGRWYDSGSDTAETAIRLRPGVGYYLYNTEIENPTATFDWAYPRPY